MFKTIIKGGLKGLAEVFISIVIPITVISYLATKAAGLEKYVSMTEIQFRYPIEQILVPLVFMYILFGILEEHKTWRYIGGGLKIFVNIIGFIIIFMLLNGGIINYTGIVEGIKISVTADFRPFIYVYASLILLPSVVASVINMASKASRVSE